MVTSKETCQSTLEAQQNKLLDNNSLTTKLPPASLWFSKRLLVAVFMFTCCVNMTFLRHNISIAVVDMTSTRNETGNSTISRAPEFNWSSKTIGFVLSIFYYGGLLSFTGGYIVTKFGGATSCTLSMMLSGITTIFQPVILYYNFPAFLICRILTGFFDSFAKVSMLEVCSKWIPKNERSKLMSFIISGFNVGTTMVHGVCAVLAYSYGWPMIFYATGSISLVLSILIFILVKNQPSDDKSISKKELVYIKQGVVTSEQKKTVHPYRRILLSPAIWALLMNRFTQFWVTTILVTCLPLYIKDLTQQNINKVGLFSSLPNIASIFMFPICGTFLNYSRKFSASTTRVHKILVGCALISISVLFGTTAMISNFTVTVFLFVLVQMFLSIVNLISEIITISIVPGSSSAIAGLNMFVISMTNIVARLVTGFMTPTRSMAEWNNCFILSSGIAFLNAVVFLSYLRIQ
ncbi:sialin-like isoform X2 [Planococcus citri]|uniref:sialin-like isoform X2 n=1 Tax=Planococcus citri TaxID=170843 RepID=UPI0031F9FCC7